jgi:Leucine Rich Repeat
VFLLHLLVSLRLNDNFWVGTIPDVYEDYDRLEFFDISNNQLTGIIPRSIFSIPTVRFIYMSNCSLSGTIPREYSDPPILRDLYLDGNELTGTVPSIGSGDLEQLNEFLLHNNMLIGVMPSSVCNLRDEFILDDLFADCGGEDPVIDCDFPDCCNRCFNGEDTSSSRRLQRQQGQRVLR